MGGELGPWEGILSTRFYYAEFQGTEHQLKGPGLFDFGVWKKPRVSVATDTRIAETYHHNQRNQICHMANRKRFHRGSEDEICTKIRV